MGDRNWKSALRGLPTAVSIGHQTGFNSNSASVLNVYQARVDSTDSDTKTCFGVSVIGTSMAVQLMNETV